MPLFVEELTQMVIEPGLLREVDGCYELTGPLTVLAILCPSGPLGGGERGSPTGLRPGQGVCIPVN